MPGRRTLAVLTVLLTALAVGAALEAGDRDERSETPLPPSSSAGSRASRRIVARIAAASPRPPTVRARVGDLVKVTVTSRATGAVTVDGYDRVEPVDAQSPARFSFIAERAGSFPMRFRESATGPPSSPEGPPGRRIALLVVGEAQASG